MTYVIAGAIGAFLSLVGLLFAATGGLDFATKIGTFLLLAHLASIIYVAKGKTLEIRKWRSIALMMPLPFVYISMLVFHLGNWAFTTTKPDSEAFVLACKSAGPKYKRRPTDPVRSVAFTWDTSISPTFNQFSVSQGTRMTSYGRFDPTYRELFDYIEKKSYAPGGVPNQGQDEPYIRFPQSGDYYGIPELTADILVHYKISPESELRKAANDQGIVKYLVTIIDRRTHEELATLQYAVDAKNRRGCGLTSDRGLSVHEFVLSSLGLGIQSPRKAP